MRFLKSLLKPYQLDGEIYSNGSPIFLLDFDGTIAHTEELMLQKFNEAAIEMNLKNMTTEDFKSFRHLESKAILNHLGVKFWQLPKLVDIVKSKMEKEIDTCKVSEGLEQFIKKSKDRNIDLVLATSNSLENVEKILIKHKISDPFKFKLTSINMFSKAKVLKKLLKKIKHQNIFYVGDEIRDIKACKKAKVKVIAVDWGFNSSESLKNNNPTHLASTWDEVLNIVS